MAQKMLSSGPPLSQLPGCVFEYHGRIPETVYSCPEVFESPLEEAVFNNDLDRFNRLVQEGHKVTVRLKIGQMTCLEYAAMMGYEDILTALINSSSCSAEIRQYFALDDIVERAYLISRNKSAFFDREALAEANRIVAALFTAVAYDRPECVRRTLGVVGRREATRSCFDVVVSNDGPLAVTRALSVGELAWSLGHTECYHIVTQWHAPPSVCG